MQVYFVSFACRSGHREERHETMNISKDSDTNRFRFACSHHVRKTRTNTNSSDQVTNDDTMLKNDTPIGWILVDPSRYYLRIIDMIFDIQGLHHMGNEIMWYEQVKAHDDQGEVQEGVKSDTKIEALRALSDVQLTSESSNRPFVVSVLLMGAAKYVGHGHVHVLPLRHSYSQVEHSQDTVLFLAIAVVYDQIISLGQFTTKLFHWVAHYTIKRRPNKEFFLGKDRIGGRKCLQATAIAGDKLVSIRPAILFLLHKRAIVLSPFP